MMAAVTQQTNDNKMWGIGLVLSFQIICFLKFQTSIMVAHSGYLNLNSKTLFSRFLESEMISKINIHNADHTLAR